jgi:outer membrane protein
MRSACSLSLSAGLILLAGATPALAQDSLTSPERIENWNVTFGGGLRYEPDYLGSNDYAFRPRPILRFERGLGSRWWSAEDDMIGVGFLEGENWRFGASGAFLWQRVDNSNRALRGLGTVGFGFELGVFAEYYVMPWLRARADIRRGFFAHDALLADFKLDAFKKISDRWTIGIGPRLSVVSDDYNRTYFGVTPAQAAASNLRVSRPGGGLQSYGALLQVTYHWSKRAETTGYIEYKRLVGDAARSDIVSRFGSPDQFVFGIATTWTIDLGRTTMMP